MPRNESRAYELYLAAGENSLAKEAAIAAATALQQTVNALLRPYTLAAGIGLHKGEVVEGLLGTAKTRHYDLVGGAVNTASRLTAFAQPGEILVSDTLLPWLNKPASSPRPFHAKGKREPVLVYALDPA